MIIDLLQQYSAIIVALTGAAVGTAFIWRKLLKPITILLQAQLTPNDGGSLVDKVNQIGPNYSKVEEHWAEQVAVAKTLAEKVEATRVELAEKVEATRLSVAKGHENLAKQVDNIADRVTAIEAQVSVASAPVTVLVGKPS